LHIESIAIRFTPHQRFADCYRPAERWAICVTIGRGSNRFPPWPAAGMIEQDTLKAVIEADWKPPIAGKAGKNHFRQLEPAVDQKFAVDIGLLYDSLHYTS
jgi:hypothetical protein